jgi:NTP pyrophosphatase (non-canonical NTP hydrolase)
MSDFDALLGKIEDFVARRDWDQFHMPRNLALALGGEVGELLAELQWISDDQVQERLEEGLRERLADEAADVLIYLLLLCKSCGVDLSEATQAKIQRNETRFDQDLHKGKADRGLREG